MQPPNNRLSPPRIVSTYSALSQVSLIKEHVQQCEYWHDNLSDVISWNARIKVIYEESDIPKFRIKMWLFWEWNENSGPPVTAVRCWLDTSHDHRQNRTPLVLNRVWDSRSGYVSVYRWKFLLSHTLAGVAARVSHSLKSLESTEEESETQILSDEKN